MTRIFTAVVTIAVLTASGAAISGPRHHHDDQGSADGVIAESRFGHGTVAGPVRAARYGYEVRLPGGTWEACKRSCSETLRVSTVDFWEAQNNYGIGAECGIFGCLEVRYPR
jgi:hypothetical protein